MLCKRDIKDTISNKMKTQEEIYPATRVITLVDDFSLECFLSSLKQNYFLFSAWHVKLTLASSLVGQENKDREKGEREIWSDKKKGFPVEERSV